MEKAILSSKINSKDFERAMLPQLLQILFREDCPMTYKCAAEFEIKRREQRDGIPIINTLHY